MPVASLLAFTVAATLLTVAPGLDTALVLRTAVVSGARSGMVCAVGIALGCFSWGVLAALGLGALLAASQVAYDIVKWVGAAYLFYLGVKLLIAPRASFAQSDPTSLNARDGRRHLVRGLFTNLLNPKVGVFYVSLLPQFVPPHTNVLGLTLAMTAIHAGLGLVWFALLCSATRPIAKLLRRATVVRWLDRITGSVFLTFGAKLALDRR